MTLRENVARALCRQYEIDDGYSVEQAERHADGPMRANFLTSADAVIPLILDEARQRIESLPFPFDGEFEPNFDGTKEAAIRALTLPEERAEAGGGK